MSQTTAKPDLYLNIFGTSLGPAIRSVKISTSQDLLDASAANDAHHVFWQARQTSHIVLEAFWELGNPNPGTVFLAGREGTLIYGPLGTANGRPKWQGRVIVRETSIPWTRHDGAILHVTLQLTGAWSVDGYQGATF